MRRASDERSGGLVTAGLLAVVVSLVGLAGAVRIAQTAIPLGPEVGDIVQFDPHAYMPVDAKTQVAAARPNGGSCLLNVATIHADGGSLIVEQTLRAGTKGQYLVHWAGARTADGAGDCGTQATLKLNDAKLDVLALAAGGWGVHPTGAQSP